MGESTVDEMPFVMVNVDSVAKDNGEIVVDGVKAQDYLHHRASTSHGGFTMPEEVRAGAKRQQKQDAIYRSATASVLF